MSDIAAAILKNDTNTLNSKLNKSNIDTPGEEGYTPLYFACMKREVKDDVVAAILKLGAKVDAKGSDKETPLYIAVFNNRPTIVDLLVKSGADVNSTNGQLKDTALHVAARLGHGDLVTYLLSHKADINVRNGRLETPLFSAAKCGRHDTVCLLMEKGANISIPDSEDRTPLYIASEKGLKHVVIVLKADLKDLRHAKAEADVELRLRPAPIPSSNEIVDRASTDKEFNEKVRRGSLPVAPPTETAPMEVVPIHVPEPKKMTHDPFTGASHGPCRSLEEVGYDEPPPIPKELQNRPPPKPQRVGGTSMVVTTEEGSKPAIRVDELMGEPETEFYAPAKKK
ncbi:Ankyrin repeats (3 copies)/Ankyrin repeat/Ankyrin repeats (many copies), putative [Angomonas deanei]|uniref:Ankyrin repeats (3 copies)/Ankyrin repeat/Ankyrin repeats (Many copies), putative n=1 Tax=Angomonas deanei TaxID=59799 RepID=A0A7G2C5T0_9TRYP|nr:Ankyrin repeats (3 copies)/Ankyrin repeat/Ankyrin repeats (many copies), putative [Angomonas deanei]